MKKSLLLGGFVVAAPLALLLSGCSGGGLGNLPFPTPQSTATPKPQSTATPVPTAAFNLVPNLTFSALTSNSNINPAPLTSFSDLSDPGAFVNLKVGGSVSQSVSFTGAGTTSGTVRRLALNIAAFRGQAGVFRVGQTIALGDSSQVVQIIQTTSTGSPGFWEATSGSAKVTALGTHSITLQLVNVRFDPSAQPLIPGRGSFTLNGTVAATGLTIVNG